MCQGFFHLSSWTAFWAASRTLAGSEPMMVCSRLDLFQTGVTWAPFSEARTQACNWALAWCAKRSPMPRENLPNASDFIGSRVKMAMVRARGYLANRFENCVFGERA